MADTITIISSKNLPDKAAFALLDKARSAGFVSIRDMVYEFLPDGENGKKHKFSAETV